MDQPAPSTKMDVERPTLPTTTEKSDTKPEADTPPPEAAKTTIPRLQTVIGNLSIPDPSFPGEMPPPTVSTPTPAGGEPLRQPTPMAPSYRETNGRLVEYARPLDVTDALGYLDSVKYQFRDEPDVYNHFLDIMKDFKGGMIDTPGVIERVSLLFNGYPELIQGFNTFLPPGYNIECSTNPLKHNIITVTTPAGVTTTTQLSEDTHPLRMHRVTSPAAISGTPQDGTSGLPSSLLLSGPGSMAAGSRPQTPSFAHGEVQPPTSPSSFGGSTHAASFLGGLSGKGNVDKPGPPGSDEFHHAIQYVNKIKTRFENDTDTYKQFLEILHTYRKEQKSQDDSQVYAQVQILFKDAPDLLAEFKDFLPSASGGFSGGHAPSGPSGESQDLFINQTGTDRADKRGANADLTPAPAAAKRKKRPLEKEVAPPPAPIPAAKSSASRAKKIKNNHSRLEPGSPNTGAYHSHPSSPALAHTYATTHHQQQQPQTHTYQSVSHFGGPTSVQDDVMFFERAKKVLESRETYEEFLKLLTLFSKEIIDTKTLIQRAEAFLVDGDLLGQFKDLLGWDDRKNNVENGPEGSIRTWPVDSISRPTLDTDERSGASYRRLPIGETKLACSGRDELCKSVLNDEWVSHPTWASEETGFVAHKKNIFEDALGKSEEERHEYQLYIEILTRTIAILQPLSERIDSMTAEERHAYRLPADFGGTSKSIYHRAIKRVYGRDSAGLEVLQALQEAPAVAIPVVLPRLKQKNEECRRMQREWNRVWREVDARNFHKSLDHQGITFKANDKKNITTRSFVTELETAKADLLDSHANKADASSMRSWHLQFIFADTPVLQDTLKLVFSFLDRSQQHYSPPERRAIERLLRSLVPLFFMQPMGEFDAVFGSPIIGEGEDLFGFGDEGGGSGSAGPTGIDESDEPNAGNPKQLSKSGRRSAGGNGASGGSGVPPNDLRKKLLKTAQEKAAAKQARSVSGSRHASPGASDDAISPSSPSPASHAQTHAHAASTARSPGGPTMVLHRGDDSFSCDDEWAKLMPMEGGDATEVGLVMQQPFFANTTFYTLFRLIQLVYSRLLMCKELTVKLASMSAGTSVFNVNPVAEELGLVDSSGPGAVLALAAQSEAAALQALQAQQAESSTGDGNANRASVTSSPRNTGQTPTEPQRTRPEEHFYDYLLDACEKLFEGEMDQSTFEENTRFLFGTKAYQVFTLDKVIAALIKQAQTAVVDPKCQELLALLSRSRHLQRFHNQQQQTQQGSRPRDLIRYRRDAEQFLGPDDHLYRIEWVPEAKAMQIQLVGSADASVVLPDTGSVILPPAGGGAADATNNIAATARAIRWRTYVDSYVLQHATEMVSETTRARVRRPFLTRVRRHLEEDGTVHGGGKVELGMEGSTYRLVYRNGGEEIVWRERDRETWTELLSRAAATRDRAINRWSIM